MSENPIRFKVKTEVRRGDSLGPCDAPTSHGPHCKFFSGGVCYEA